MNLPPIAEAEFLDLGLSKQNLRLLPAPMTAKQLEAQRKNFRRFYGIEAKTCLAIYKELNTSNGSALKGKVNPDDLLMMVEWLRAYDTDFKTAAKYGLCEKTGSKYLWRYTRAIQALKEKKIKWLERWSNVGSEIVIVSVDGVHCTISEPRQMPSSKWYSHKSHGPALAYEIAIAVQENKIVHIHGPFPAGVPDLKIFRSPGGLKSKIPDGKLATADRGYQGERALRLPNARDTELATSFKKRSQARHETFNARLKGFKILSTRFRHSHNGRKEQGVTCHDNHKAVFEAVCVLLQYDMENGHPLFAV
jgi:hypothetical protein